MTAPTEFRTGRSLRGSTRKPVTALRERLIEATRRQLERTNQRRVAVAGVEVTPMTTRLAVVAAAIVFAVVAGVLFLPRFSGPGRSLTESGCLPRPARSRRDAGSTSRKAIRECEDHGAAGRPIRPLNDADRLHRPVDSIVLEHWGRSRHDVPVGLRGPEAAISGSGGQRRRRRAIRFGVHDGPGYRRSAETTIELAAADFARSALRRRRLRDVDILLTTMSLGGIGKRGHPPAVRRRLHDCDEVAIGSGAVP